MSSTMNMDNDMSSNISNLNNIPNLAKNIEQGLDNSSTHQLQNQQQQSELNTNYNPTQPNFQKMQEYQQMHQMSNMMGIQQPMNMQNMMGLQQHQQQQQQASYNDMNNYNLMHQNFNTSETKKPSVLNYVSENFREPILIAVVFVILNHPALLNALSKYIPHIGVGEVEYSMFNLVLRGLVMGVVIVLLNKTLLK